MSLATRPPVLTPLGYQQLTVTTLQTLTVPAGANLAIIRGEAQTVRWRDDGTAPTASVGMTMLVADPPLIYSGDLTKLKFIAATAGGIINVNYYQIIG